MSTRIQDEPESTIGRKPPLPEHPERPQHGRARSGAASRHEEGDEGEAGSRSRDREGGERPNVHGRE
jgi:hypothetical protein